MRPDRAIRLVFSAASAVGRATGTQPDTVGAALQQITATVESACQRVSIRKVATRLLIFCLYFTLAIVP